MKHHRRYAAHVAGPATSQPPPPCTCTPGTEANGWHETRCRACRADDTRIFAASIARILHPEQPS